MTAQTKAETTPTIATNDQNATSNRIRTFTHELSTEITIGAPPETVWAVLTDMSRYREWNPFIIEAAGQAREGSKLSVRIKPEGGRAASFTPMVTVADPSETLEWLGRFIAPRLYDGRHRFDLKPTHDGTSTHLRHSERFSGLLVPVIIAKFGAVTLQGFVAMNEALKARAEAMATER